MRSDNAPASRAHERRSHRLLAESALVWLALLAAAPLASAHLPLLWPAVALAQGLWLYRLYAVAHEASHRKLYPERPRLNDLAGSLAMAWVWAPITIFRQIHDFHHGSNRRAEGVSTLEVFVVRGRLPRWCYKAAWYGLVFACGFFLHTLVSILVFLVVPTRVGRRLSPAFASWTPRKRATAWAEMALAVAIHAAAFALGGWEAWWTTLGAGVLVFAWVWSAMLYIYHYRTPISPKVAYNVRTIPRVPFFSWLLLNFNHHAVHHANPRVPWYELPMHAPPAAASEQSPSLAHAVLAQLAGPTIVVRDAS